MLDEPIRFEEIVIFIINTVIISIINIVIDVFHFRENGNRQAMCWSMSEELQWRVQQGDDEPREFLSPTGGLR